MNSLDNPLRDLHEALAHAQYEGFSDIEYETRDFEAIKNAKTGPEKAEAFHKTTRAFRRPYDRDFHVSAMFPQTWGSTALGHGGMGGASVTTAYTIVLECAHTQECLVYFGGQFCYSVDRRNQTFRDDLEKRNLASKRESTKYSVDGEVKK
jgi:hypothetical protein